MLFYEPQLIENSWLDLIANSYAYIVCQLLILFGASAVTGQKDFDLWLVLVKLINIIPEMLCYSVKGY